MRAADALHLPPDGPELPSDVRWMQWGARVLAVLGVLLLLATLARWVVQRPAMDWRLIHIDGEVNRNSLATLRANALPALSGNFITMDLRRTRAAFEATPWVRRAEVRRVWPAQLRVTLEEHRPVATWDGRGDWGEPPLERALLNSHGEVFHANLGEVEDADLPQFAGPAGTEAQVLRLWQRLSAMHPRDSSAITRLELSGRGSWRATWESGATVEIGRGSETDLVDRYRAFLTHAFAIARRYGTHIQSADLRHPDGYALRLVGIGTQSPSKPPVKNPVKRKP
jgi:cell division protein FtsQ